MKLKQILNLVKKKNPKADLALIGEAYDFMLDSHKDQKRLSGELYINHPLNVAYILAELNMDSETIISGLLHDVVEDTDVSLEELRKKFGEDIATMVDGVTKITELKIRAKRDAESIRKLLLATNKDIRVIIIKLADKLHNMRTLKYLSEENRKRISQETLDIYAPLAYRIGLARIKWELEDLAFKELNPEMFDKFKKKFGKGRIQREIEVRRLKSLIEKELKKHGIKAKVLGRPKHFYSIYKKMKAKKRSFEEIYDLLALRIITEDVKNCYEVLGIIHSLWKPIPGEFDDYVAMPKANMYQSLHTAVIAFNQPVEFQIRTEEMDSIAQQGIAAHWGYKGIASDKKFDKRLAWIKEVLELQKESKNVEEFMDSLKIDFFEDEIYVFTPQGKVVELPKGSCPIDFAYSIHTNIGDKCTGAIVNGRIVPLRNTLVNGDIINILTAKNGRPRRDWLKIVKTAKARNKIKQYIRKYENIPVGSRRVKEVESKKDEIDLVVVENKELKVDKLAKCCHPVPRNKIVAYQVGQRGFTIHKNTCSSLKHKKKDRVFDAKWSKLTNIPIRVIVIAEDRVGLFADILNTVAATNTYLSSSKAKTVGNDMVECSFTMTSENMDHLKDILDRIKKIRSVRKTFIEGK